MNQKWKNKIYKPGKFDDRAQFLQLARSRNKRQNETEMCYVMNQETWF